MDIGSSPDRLLKILIVIVCVCEFVCVDGQRKLSKLFFFNYYCYFVCDCVYVNLCMHVCEGVCVYACTC